MSPQRIQLKRTKGWRKPEGAIVVSRPSRWGNPVTIGCWVSAGSAWREARRCTASTYPRNRADLVMYYRLGMLDGGLVIQGSVVAPRLAVPLPSRADIRAELRGRDLACWCPLDQPCHADVLLEIANEVTT